MVDTLKRIGATRASVSTQRENTRHSLSKATMRHRIIWPCDLEHVPCRITPPVGLRNLHARKRQVSDKGGGAPHRENPKVFRTSTWPVHQGGWRKMAAAALAVISPYWNCGARLNLPMNYADQRCANIALTMRGRLQPLVPYAASYV